jgi:hypothetical protein
MQVPAPGTPASVASSPGQQRASGAASSRPDLAPPSLASAFSGGASSARIGGGSVTTFFCKKCKLQQPLEKIIMKGNVSVCTPDNSSYKALSDRWKTNSSLRVWWNGLTEEGQTQWYRKWQTVEKGQKRKFDECTYIEQQTDEAVRQEGAVDRYIPWKLFRRHGFLDGASEAELIKDFQNMVQDPHITCKFERGEWLVPEFQGTESFIGNRAVSSTSMSRSASVQSQTQLNQLLLSGRQMLTNQTCALTSAAQSSSPGPPVTNPQCRARIEDQPPVQDAPKLFCNAVLREVFNNNFLHTKKQQCFNRVSTVFQQFLFLQNASKHSVYETCLEFWVFGPV